MKQLKVLWAAALVAVSPGSAWAGPFDNAVGTWWGQGKEGCARQARPAEDIADVIAFLCSDDARFMTGQGFFVDGGAMTRQ